jgi:outer membrane protein assembly factor BamB
VVAASPGKQSTYLFDVATGQQIAKLVAPDGGKSGSTLAIDGNRIVTAHASKLHVFDATSGQHIRQIELHFSANALALDGGTVLVGSDLDDTAGPAAGAAYLFSIETGELLGQLLATDAAPLEWVVVR